MTEMNDILDQVRRETGMSEGKTNTSASWERRGLDLLFAEYPAADAVNITQNQFWLSVDLAVDQDIHKFAIWRNTGCVYKVDEHGASADDPFLIPKGSPYTDHTSAA